MGESSLPTALDLFRLYQPRTRAIIWQPEGLSAGYWDALLPDKHGHNYYFYPDREGLQGDIVPGWLDLRQHGAIVKGFSYDASSEVRVVDQFESFIWHAIMAGPFANKTFAFDPDWSVVGSLLRDYRPGKGLSIPVTFTHDGDVIPGLQSPRGNARSWSAFFPTNSPELTAFMMALSLEQSVRAKKSKEEVDHLYQLTERLIAEVPA